MPVDGFVDIPTRSGVGIDLVDDPAAVRPPFSKPVLMRLHVEKQCVGNDSGRS